MSDFRFELDSDGVRALLQGPEMQAILRDLGQQKASAAGPGYTSAVHVHQKRAVVNIYPETKEAVHDNYESNTLLKVLGS